MNEIWGQIAGPHCAEDSAHCAEDSTVQHPSRPSVSHNMTTSNLNTFDYRRKMNLVFKTCLSRDLENGRR